MREGEPHGIDTPEVLEKAQRLARETDALFNIPPEGAEEEVAPEERKEPEVTPETHKEKKKFSAKEALGSFSGVAREWLEKRRGDLGPHFQKVAERAKSPEFLRGILNKKILGTPLKDHLVLAGGGFAIRSVTRWGLGVLTGGSGYFLAAATGAVAGGVSEGVRTYRREKAKPKEALSEEEFELGVGVLNRRVLGRKELDRYLELEEEQEAAEGLSEEKKLLREVLEGKLRSAEIRRAVVKGALRGAAVGALGGALGAGLSDLIGHFVFPEGTKETVQAAKTAGVGEALRQKLEAAASEAYSKTYEKAIGAGLAGFENSQFTASVDQGEGFTHVARKLIHDYTSQQVLLGGGTPLSRAQLVYAEDSLRRILETPGKVLQPGEVFQVKGERISHFLEHAKVLGEEQIKNIHEKWIGEISEKNWQKILDYGSTFHKDNAFSGGVIQEAREKAAAVSRRAAEEIGRAMASPPSPEAVKAAGSWFSLSLAKYAGGAAGLLGLGAFAYRHREALARKLKEAGGTISALKGALPKGKFKLPEVRMGIITEAVKRVRGRGKGKTPVVSEEFTEAPPAGVVPVVEEVAPVAPPEERAGEVVERERAAAEEQKKIAADPLFKFLAEKSIKTDPKRIHYSGIHPEDIGKKSGRSVSFSNYSDFRKYWEGLTRPEQRKARTYVTTVGKEQYSSLGIWGPAELWKELEEKPEVNEEYRELQKKILSGILADEYRGLPAKEEITSQSVETLIEEMHERIQSFGIFVGKSWDISPEEEYGGLKTLQRVLENFSLERLRGRVLRIGSPKVRMGPGGMTIIQLDSSWSAEDMAGFIENSLPETERLGDLARSNVELSAKIRGLGVDMWSPIYDDKVTPDNEKEGLEKLYEALRGFPVDTLSGSSLRIGFEGVRKSGLSDAIMIEVDPTSSVGGMREYLTRSAEEAKKLKETT